MNRAKKTLLESCLIVVLSVFLVIPLALGQKKADPAVHLDYCSLINSDDKYDGNLVSFEALMFHSTIGRVDGGDEFLYATDCNNEDFFTVTDYTQAKYSDKIFRFKKKLKPEREFVLKVSIIGRFETAKTPIFGHLGWTLHKLFINKVVEISDVTGHPDYPQPDWNANTIITGETARLRTINARMLRFLYGASDGGMLEKISPRAKFATDNAPEPIPRDIPQLRKELAHDPSLPTEVTILQIKYEKGKYVIWGTFIVGKDKNTQVLVYETVFSRTGDEFQLESAILHAANP